MSPIEIIGYAGYVIGGAIALASKNNVAKRYGPWQARYYILVETAGAGTIGSETPTEIYAELALL